MNFKRLASNNGFSLTEALIGVAILGISTLAASSFMSYQIKSNHQLQASQSRDFILRQIQTNLASSRAILKSKENIANQAYKYCVEGKKLADGTLDKTSCKNTLLSNVTEKTPFVLFSGQGSGAITGAPLKPQLYTSAGDPCAQAGPGCIIEASSWFVASCAGNTASCATADSIEFRFLVQKATTADIVMKPASGFFADPTMLDAASSESTTVSAQGTSITCFSSSKGTQTYTPASNICCTMTPSGRLKCISIGDTDSPSSSAAFAPGGAQLTALGWRKLSQSEGRSLIFNGKDAAVGAYQAFGSPCASYGMLNCVSAGSPCPDTEFEMCDYL